MNSSSKNGICQKILNLIDLKISSSDYKGRGRMKTKITIGIICIILGAIFVGFSFYVKAKVADGQSQIKQAEKSIDTGNKLFSLTPATKDLGKGLTGGAQKKIDAGKEQIIYYSNLADMAQVGGIILMALGVGVLLIRARKGKK